MPQKRLENSVSTKFLRLLEKCRVKKNFSQGTGNPGSKTSQAAMFGGGEGARLNSGKSGNPEENRETGISVQEVPMNKAGTTIERDQSHTMGMNISEELQTTEPNLDGQPAANVSTVGNNVNGQTVILNNNIKFFD